MKRIFAFLAIATIYSSVYAQDTKLLLELGGTFSKRKMAPYVDRNKTSSLSDSKYAHFNIQLGYQVTSNSYLGLSYQHSKGTILQATEFFVNSDYFSHSYSQEKVKIGSYGIFYRHYLLPIDVSRWNGFAELATSLQYQNRSYLSSTYVTSLRDYEIDYENYLSSEREVSAWDTDLRIGGSYRISQNFLIQLSLHSVGSINHSLKDSWNSELEKKTTYEFFKSPLSNTYLSILLKI
ncbi:MULTISPECIES: hypothetical protein [Sphingobacterium]|uniref:hypothetical protein n=1 Tax=Sphingobacterium TaxID=28453 RepID=UPI0013DC1EDB|nr:MULTISPECIES: hypothetical protein [unclassified Sphingobacterium]